NEKLGFHVHEKGECEGDFSSAGGHFNPTNLPHGTPGADSHVGDLGNLETNDEGVADFSYVSEQMTLDESKTSVLGKAIIIHGGTDDFDTQPSGDSGHRIACGVIQSI